MTLELREATNDLQEQIEAAKEQLSAESEELKIMIRSVAIGYFPFESLPICLTSL